MFGSPLRLPVRGIVLAHVAEPTGELGESLTVGTVALPLRRQKAGGLNAGRTSTVTVGS